jgi:hypothetical protein
VIDERHWPTSITPGQLLARQGEVYGQASQMEKLGREHSALPDDLLNFHCDPVACAVALGWSGATVEDLRLVQRNDGIVLPPES